eukprot:Rhum_TRINITY_DN15233_c5_g1::Rhum_TRINITY_DN15233_c5_g1_i6::g.145923::m.145923
MGLAGFRHCTVVRHVVVRGVGGVGCDFCVFVRECRGVGRAVRCCRVDAGSVSTRLPVVHRRGGGGEGGRGGQLAPSLRQHHVSGREGVYRAVKPAGGEGVAVTALENDNLRDRRLVAGQHLLLDVVVTELGLVLEHRHRPCAHGCLLRQVLVLRALNPLAHHCPLAARKLEARRVEVVSCGDADVVRHEGDGGEGKTLHRQRLQAGVAAVRGVQEDNRRVVRHGAEPLRIGAEGNRVHPRLELVRLDHGTHLARVLDLSVHRLEVGGHEVDPSVGGRSREDQVLRLRHPRHGGHGRRVPLGRLRHPPVVRVVVVADVRLARPCADGELLLGLTPLAHEACVRARRAQHHKLMLPLALVLRPHVRRAVLAARHDAVLLRAPVHAEHVHVVRNKGGLEGPGLRVGAVDLVDLDVRRAVADGHEGAGLVVGMAGDGRLRERGAHTLLLLRHRRLRHCVVCLLGVCVRARACAAAGVDHPRFLQ